ncbi:MAG: hypothetical protein IKD69_04380 [Solobacterium sp.]|nr:hypothetical protein [Solobacterium sp.]
MAQLSRTVKYKALRDQLMNDSETDLSAPDLSGFEKQLNKIDSDNFAAPKEYSSPSSEATHARTAAPVPPKREEPDPVEESPLFDSSMFRSSGYTGNYDNDYLDQYIREVKQYNIEQGNAVSDNTSVNILKGISNEPDLRSSRPTNPFTEKRAYEKRSPAAKTPARRERSERLQRQDPLDLTGSIPRQSEPEDVPLSSTNGYANMENRSKEDIMAEVQRLVETSSIPTFPKDEEANEPARDDGIGADTLRSHLEEEKKAREKLLYETAQMRLQLDGYEDNLTEVSDKMRYTNKVLNFTLIVLIIALAVIALLLVYWIVIARVPA